jgi:hypothetical protein
VVLRLLRALFPLGALMSDRFADRFGQEYDVVFDGRQELLPPRPSRAHPLSVMGHHNALTRREVLDEPKRATERARVQRYRRRRAIERAVIARTE